MATGLARAAFVIVLLVAVFGTRVAFGPELGHLAESTSSSRINQVVLLAAAAFAAYPAWRERGRLFQLVRRERFLSALLGWSGLTVLWSSAPWVSLKRFAQFGIITLVIAVFMRDEEESDRALSGLQILLGVCLVLSLLAVLFVPLAIDPHFSRKGLPYWRGILHSKNALGQRCLVGAIVFAYAFSRSTDPRRFLYAAGLAVAAVLLAGSGSMSPLVVGVLLPLLVIGFELLRRAERETWFGGLLLAALVAVPLFAYVAAPSIAEGVLAAFGRNLTLSDRVQVWAEVGERFLEHPFFGEGYGGVWSNANAWVREQYATGFYPNGAHQGFLDIANETGSVGLALVFGMLVSFIRGAIARRRVDVWFWLFIATVLLNFVESTLLRPREVTSILFLVAYVRLFALPPEHGAADSYGT